MSGFFPIDNYEDNTQESIDVFIKECQCHFDRGICCKFLIVTTEMIKRFNYNMYRGEASQAQEEDVICITIQAGNIEIS